MEKHDLLPLPEDHPFEEGMTAQCVKCGATFSTEGVAHAAFLISCSLEQSMRQFDPETALERPIIVGNTERKK